MQSILETFPHLTAYVPALYALTLLCLAVLIQGFLAGVLGFAGGEETAGLPLRGDHSKLSFRAIRTYQNSTENFSVLIATTLLAIIAGVGVTFVNVVVWLHVATRLVYWGVYYAGIGKVGGGVRTITYVAALFMNIVLAVATAYRLMF